MAALFFYVCVFLKLTLVAGQSVHYVLKGREAILSPALSKAPDDILWKHNGVKVITFDSAEERVFHPYEGRVTLGWGTAELTIADVRYEDSGEYELDALFRDRLSRSQYMLKVLDKVSKPVIRCEMNDDSSNSTSMRRATLLCSSDSNTPEALTFKWNLEGKSHLGQTLTIALGNEHDHIEYSCTATNPLHAESNVFLAKDCYTEGSSPALDVIVPIVIASLILLAFCIFPFIFRHQIKRACLKRGTDDLEKQITVADCKNKDEGSPLMGDIHRQETFPSKQRLLVQSDFEKDSLQKQEITKELEELRASKKVNKRSKKFKNHTESQPDTVTDEENDTDITEMTTPSSPIRDEQVDSEGDTDLSHKDSYIAPKSDKDSDASQYHDAPEQAEPVLQSPRADPKDLLPRPGKHESGGQTDSEGEPDVHYSDHEGAPKMDVAGDSSSVHSGQEEAPEQAVKSQTNLGSSVPQENEDLQITNESLSETNEEFKTESTVAHQPQKDLTDEEPVLPQPDPAATLSQQPDSLLHPNAHELELESQSEPDEPKHTEQADPNEKSTPTLVVEDPQTDASENKSVTSEPEATKESKVSDDSQMSLLHSVLPESQQQSPLQSSLASVQDLQSEPEPEPEDKEKTSPETNPDPVDPQRNLDLESETSDSKNEKTEDAALTDLQPPSPDSEPAAADSPSSQSDQDHNPDSWHNVEEDKGPVESNSSTDEEPQTQDSSSEESSKQTSAAEITPTDDSEMPGSPSHSPLQSSLASVHDSKNEPEPEDKGKSSPETKPDPVDSQRDSDHESETSDSKDDKAEDAALTDPQTPSPDADPLAADSPSSQSDQNHNPDSWPTVEEAKGPAELNSHTDEEAQKQDSFCEESEESKQTSVAEITPTDDFKLPGSEKESDESTHPPASALSQAAHNKESKDTDAENASSAQVSEETKDNTDKESDSSGSEQINQATKSKAGQQES